MSDRGDDTPRTGSDRRGFLKASAAVAGGLIFGEWAPAQAADIPKRRLGRTGLMVTTVSFGAIQLSDVNQHARVLEHAIDAGMNLVHVAPGYTGGRAIQVVGQVMARKRSRVFLALKADPGNIDQHLRTLRSDYVDILIPNHEDAAWLTSTQTRDAFARLKQQRKIRFAGFAAHSRMRDAIVAANRGGFMDCALVKYSVACRADVGPAVNQAANGSRIGFMAMKSSEGLNRNDPNAFAAGLRSLLAGNPNMATLTLGMASVQHVDRNVNAVLRQSAMADIAFADYDERCAGGMCSTCGRCQLACPQGVAVMDYLRAWNYRDRGDGELARELVDSLPGESSLAACTNCQECARACQRRIDVTGRMREATWV